MLVPPHDALAHEDLIPDAISRPERRHPGPDRPRKETIQPET